MRTFLSTMTFAVVLLCGGPVLSGAGTQNETQQATEFFKQALELHKSARYDEAWKLAERARDLIVKQYGENHPYYAGTVSLLGSIRHSQRRFQDAVPFYEKALAIYERTTGAKSAATAGALLNLAGAYEGAGRIEEAIPLFDRARAVYEETAGAEHPNVLALAQTVATLHLSRKDYGSAIREFERAIAIRNKASKPDDPTLATMNALLGRAYQEHGRPEAAIERLKRALAIYEKTLGPEDDKVATTLNVLGLAYVDAGQYQEATPVYERALAIREKSVGPEDVKVATLLNNAALAHKLQGQRKKAILYYERALAINEKVLGPDDPEVATVLTNLANVYGRQGRTDDAIALVQRALAIREKALGPSHPLVAQLLNNLAAMRDSQGRFLDAIGLYERAITIQEKGLGPSHPELATTLGNLAVAYVYSGRLQDAIPLHQRSLAIRERALGPEHPDVAWSLYNLAAVHKDLSRYLDAIPLLERAVAIREKALGVTHPEVARTLTGLGGAHGSTGKHTLALHYFRRAAAIMTKRAELAAGSTQAQGEADPFGTYVSLVQAAYFASGQKGGDQTNLLDEAMRATQRAQHTAAGAALAKMAVRLSTQDAGLANVVREQQDLTERWLKLEKSLIAAVSQPPDRRDAKAEDNLRGEKKQTEERIAALAARLDKEFADYAAFANPKPLGVGDVRTLLEADEALVVYLVSETASFVWAVTREKGALRRIDTGAATLADTVAGLRKAIDPVMAIPAARGASPEEACRGLEPALQDGDCKAFDFGLARAHELYQLLLGQVEDVIKDKTSLVLVPSGPLTSLPFQLLVAGRPPAEGDLLARFRQADWLVRHHAIAVLPTVQSLAALRRESKGKKAANPFVGFGDPVFARAGAHQQGKEQARSPARAYSSYFRGAAADLDLLSDGLVPLPETAEELAAVASALDAPEGGVILGPKASESTVKALSESGKLSDYRIVYFATHGLVAGEIDDLAEPALALTLPKQATDVDDGLLTASEVGQLKLNAEWIVLSACNTAAGDRPGAPALSGLARAFFYAGARSLLVSHWPVNSEAAVKLTTGAFAALKAAPEISRGEALRRSMLALIDKGAPYQAHPAYWAPFVVVGSNR